jgi:spore coat polysaccharide biosynthesis protein SpsF
MGNTGVVTGIFLQARLKSTRLPGKALLKLQGLTVIEHAMSTLRLVRADAHALLTDEESAAEFEPYARKWNFRLFVGPELDVLKRYCLAAERFGVSRVVRATGDNPLVSAELTKLNLEFHEQKQADLSRFKGAPLGTGVEVVETEALVRSYSDSDDAYEHEHITTHILRNPQLYRIHEPLCPAAFRLPQARVTLDTAEDFKILEAVFTALYRHKPIETVELTAWLAEHRELWPDTKHHIPTGESSLPPQ